jgi:acyl-CoA synthetase (AMP-forming)/AMP-acid ligase II
LLQGFGAFPERVGRWRAALRAEALAPGDRVPLLVPNRIHHVCIDQAALALGLLTVPMHRVDQPENLAYVLENSGAPCSWPIPRLTGRPCSPSKTSSRRCGA